MGAVFSFRKYVIHPSNSARYNDYYVRAFLSAAQLPFLIASPTSLNYILYVNNIHQLKKKIFLPICVGE